MNKILTPHIYIDAYNKPITERVEILKDYDTLDAALTQNLIDKGFPKGKASCNDGEHNLITLQDIIDVCNGGIRYKGKLLEGVEVDSPVYLAYSTDDDGQSKVWFYGTFDGKAYRSHSRIDACLLMNLYSYIEEWLYFDNTTNNISLYNSI